MLGAERIWHPPHSGSRGGGNQRRKLVIPPTYGWSMALDIPRLDGRFEVVSDYQPAGDQPAAIADLERRGKSGDRKTPLPRPPRPPQSATPPGAGARPPRRAPGAPPPNNAR